MRSTITYINRHNLIIFGMLTRKCKEQAQLICCYKAAVDETKIQSRSWSNLRRVRGTAKIISLKIQSKKYSEQSWVLKSIDTDFLSVCHTIQLYNSTHGNRWLDVQERWSVMFYLLKQYSALPQENTNHL